MKNERQKEIEHVNPLNRYSGGPLKQRDKARQQITDNQQQNANISISRPQGEIKKAKGDVYVVNCKERKAKEHKWN
jgi:hypothetical protein